MNPFLGVPVGVFVRAGKFLGRLGVGGYVHRIGRLSWDCYTPPERKQPGVVAERLEHHAASKSVIARLRCPATPPSPDSIHSHSGRNF